MTHYVAAIIMILYSAVLFALFVPGVLFVLPQNGTMYTIVGVHALLFGVACCLTCTYVHKYAYGPVGSA